MEENKNQNNVNPKQKSNLVRNLVISVMVIICLCLLFWVFSTSAKGEYVSDTEFTNRLNSGNVKVVEINAKEINVELKDGSYMWFYNRGEWLELQIKTDINTYNAANADAQVMLYYGTTTTFSIMSIIFPLLMFVFFIIFIVIFMKQIKGANNSSMDFVKNRARVMPSKTKFTDVAGADEEKEELKEIIDFLKNPDKFRDLGARVPKGVLLVGPPGTGKTLLAKACAGEAGVPFFTISGSDFMELFVGVGASRVRDLFANAKKAKPCIIFIDEIDAIGRQRGAGLGGGNDEREQTLNQLLVEMDGFEKNENIIVMAATNRADILDPALMRPGRFDRQIYIHIPDVKGREEILKVHAKNKPLAKDVDLKQIARVTSGFTGADLENLLNESAIIAGRANRKEIIQEDINNGIVKVAVGPQKKSWLIPEKDKRITAYHEAGHAIVEKFVKNGDNVHEVSIIPRGGAAGYTISRPEDDKTHQTRGMLTDRISVLLAGRIAETLFLDDITTGASNDLERATTIARKMVVDLGMSDVVGLVNMGSQSEVFIGRDYQTRVNYSEKQAALIDDEIKKIIDKSSDVARKILKDNAKVIENMVAVLLAKETIYSEEVDMIIDGKSSEEVIKFIDEKHTKKDEKKSVDELIAIAEERSKLKNSVDEVKQEVSSEGKGVRKTTRKPRMSNKKTNNLTQNKTKKTKEESSKKISKSKKEVSDK